MDSQTIIRVYREVDFDRIKLRLVSNNIEFSTTSFKSIPIPETEKAQSFGEISINGYLNEEFLLGFEKGIRLETTQKPLENKLSMIIPSIIGISFLILIALCFKFWKASTHSLMEDKNYTYSWNILETELITKEKKSNRVSSISSDRNLNMNFEQIRSFDPNSETLFLDEDENGYFESMTVKNKDKELVCSYTNNTGDDFYDEIDFLLENGEHLLLYDDNGNGKYDMTSRDKLQ